MWTGACTHKRRRDTYTHKQRFGVQPVLLHHLHEPVYEDAPHRRRDVALLARHVTRVDPAALLLRRGKGAQGGGGGFEGKHRQTSRQRHARSRTLCRRGQEKVWRRPPHGHHSILSMITCQKVKETRLSEPRRPGREEGKTRQPQHGHNRRAERGKAGTRHTTGSETKITDL